MKPNDLAMRTTIEQLIIDFNSQLLKLKQGYKMMDDAAQTLTEKWQIDEYHGYSFRPYIHRRDRLDDIETEWIKYAWKNIIAKTQVRKILSSARYDKLMSNIEKKPPELTLENIMSELGLILDNKDELALETLKEAYDDLRPRNSRLKTNRPYLSRKVILSGMVEQYPYYYDRSWKVNGQNLIVIDRAFHLLDDNLRTQANYDMSYNSPLVDAIETCPADGKGQTTYFKFQCYKNKNLHLTMTRTDLVEKFNKIIGKHFLMPE